MVSSSFTFSDMPRLMFGAGNISLLEGLLGKNNNICILTGAKSFIETLKWNDLQYVLEKNKNTLFHFVVASEPSPELIDECVNKYRNEKIDYVVAIGGGSVIDAGKAVSAMLTKNDSIENYLEGVGTKEHDGKKIPFIALPTTAGTGSEATKNSVISRIGVNGFKRSLRHDNFMPDIAVVDPELTLSCSKQVTAYSGMDAFTQLLESYLSTAASPMTDALAFDALKKIREYLRVAVDEGTDINARSGMSYAAYISGITLANAGLGTIHGFASSLGGYYDIPHGIVCAALMAEVNRITLRELRKNKKNEVALKKYSSVGKIFSDIEGKNDDYYQYAFIDYLQKITEYLQIPSLGDFGVAKESFKNVINITGNKNNPVKLSSEHLAEILEKSL